MAALPDEVQAIGQLEQQLCEGESLLRKTENAMRANWFFMGVGLLVMVILQGAFILVGLSVITFCVWRMYRDLQSLQEIETGLQTLRVQKIDRMAALLVASHQGTPQK